MDIISTTMGMGLGLVLYTIGGPNGDTISGGELKNTFVIYVESGSVSGTLDNFVMQQEFPDFVPSTITYSEDVKGWSSFKSFIPENGLSLNKQYYTMKKGKLYLHHSNQVRNQFYDETIEDRTRY
jgi:hypothetical protein